MNLQLDNKKAFIPGPTKGIDLAIAKILAAEGVHIIINDRTEHLVAKAKGFILNDCAEASIEDIQCDFFKGKQIRA